MAIFAGYTNILKPLKKNSKKIKLWLLFNQINKGLQDPTGTYRIYNFRILKVKDFRKLDIVTNDQFLSWLFLRWYETFFWKNQLLRQLKNWLGTAWVNFPSLYPICHPYIPSAIPNLPIPNLPIPIIIVTWWTFDISQYNLLKVL